MRVRIVAVGKLKEATIRNACAEYEKRLSRYHKAEVIEVADEPIPSDAPADIARALQREAVRILPRVSGCHAVALAIDGAAPNSMDFAAQMQRYEGLGTPVCFVIGGSCGLHADVLAACAERLSLSNLTLPHNLARLVLLEQIYRAAKINTGEVYHK